jgi:hypothetical protein
MAFDRFIASLRAPALVQIALHWDAARGSKRLPAWQDIDPSAIRHHLPIVWAWRRDPKLGTLVGRLAGQGIVEAIGCQIRGRPIEDCFAPAAMPIIRERFDRMLSGPLFMHSAGPVYVTSGRYGVGERISMPLSDSGRGADGVFGATVYTFDGMAHVDQEVHIEPSTEEVEFFDLAP